MVKQPWSAGFERSVITSTDPEYPSQLKDLKKPPQTLYVLGNRKILEEEMLAIIGSRKATPHGLLAAELAAETAVTSGITVISGGAQGCDSHAQERTLELSGGVVSVAGCGADVAYPARKEKLFVELLQAGGAIISEHPWDSPPAKWRFSTRNRIIAAMARMTFVAEAGLPSGTFVAAHEAFDLGRVVVAVPGAIFSPDSKGTNFLISEGAEPVWDAKSLKQSIALCYGNLSLEMSSDSFTKGEEVEPILRSLLQAPYRPEELAHLSNNSIGSLLRVLSAYETDGMVERLIDGRFAATRKAYREVGLV